MKTTIRLATEKERGQVIALFGRYSGEIGENTVSEEFLCPYGARAAIERNQMIVAIESGDIVAAVRFYPRKRDGVVSVYQFVVDKEYRGGGLVKKMLRETGHSTFEAVCPSSSSIIGYYKKTGWVLEKGEENKQRWNLCL
jgi:predicted N-acetyltransferase YhbS